MKKFYIYCRYEHPSLDKTKHETDESVEWTQWFKVLSSKSHNTEDDANIELNELSKMSESIDKITKLKHEYKIICK